MEENPIQQPIQSPSLPKQSFKLPVTILLVAIAGVAGYAGASYYLNLWPFEASVPVPTFTPRPSPSPTQSVSVSDAWKTYESTEHGFTIKYPPNLFLYYYPEDKSGLPVIQSSPKRVELGGALPENLKPDEYVTEGFIIGLSTKKYSGVFSIDNYIKTEYPNSAVDQKTLVQVSGINGYRFTFKDEIGAGDPHVVIIANDETIEISAMGSYDIDLFNQILNTFEPILY